MKIMNKAKGINNRRLRFSSIVIGVLFLLSTVFSMTALAYTSDVSASLSVKQVFTSNVADAADSFDYSLTPDLASNPLPAGSADGSYKLTIKGSTTAGFSMSYSVPGVYAYTLTPVNAGVEGYTYESKVYHIYVYVQNGSNNDLTTMVNVTDAEGKKLGELEVDPSYYKAPAESSKSSDNGSSSGGSGSGVIGRGSSTSIGEGDVPLGVTTIDDSETPEGNTILDGDVPLGNLPKTGQPWQPVSYLLVLGFAFIIAGILFAAVGRRKNRADES